MWCIGEYGDLVVAGAVDQDVPVNASPSEVLDLLQNVLTSSVSNRVSVYF